MNVDVQLIRERGRDLSHEERKQMPVFRGVFRVSEARSTRLGRTALMAELVSPIDGKALALLPALRDVTMLFFTDGRMRITGIEEVEAVHYAQTWDVRLRA